MPLTLRSAPVRLAAIVGAAAVAYFLFHSVRAIRFPFPLDYAEGPLLEQARLLASGHRIYRASVTDYPYTVANYPPLFPLALAALGKVFGFSYGVARVLTTGAALACAVLVGAIAREAGDRLGGWIAGAVFLASPYVVFWSSLVRIDFLALAFSLGAVLLVLRRPDARATPATAALLVALAVLTRQSHLLAGPLAIAGALFVERWTRAATFVGVLLATLGPAVLLLEGVTHGGFLFHTVQANVNPFSWPLLTYFFTDLAQGSTGLFLLAAFVAGARLRERAPGAVLLGLYLVGSLLSALTIGKVGSHVNYLLEITAALSIFAGIAVARAREGGAAWLRIAAPSLVLVQMGWLLGRAVFRPENMEDKLKMREEFRALGGVLAEERGRVLADETMGMLVITGHPILLQPFEFTQLVHQGVWDQTRVLDDIHARRFALILINDGPHTPPAWTRERWTPEMLLAIHEAYEPTGALAEATLYRPASPALPPGATP